MPPALASCRRWGLCIWGHQSLIARARRENAVVVVSIFINPLQFGPQEDLANYPRPLDADRALCAAAGVDILFLPTVEMMYGAADRTNSAGLTQVVPPAGLTQHLCGRSRPGHFQGVATVVTKLLNIVRPSRTYFGQKDAQQLAIIRRLAADLNLPGEIISCPIVRAANGLAFSSRNAYLSAQEQQRATALSRGLQKAQELFENGGRCCAALVAIVRSELAAAGLEAEYIELVDPTTLQPMQTIQEVGLLAIAAQVGTARLIDNALLSQRQAIVAMDGPAGAGKSTVTRRVAQALGLRYLDTGAMYRALTWLVLDVGLDLTDEAAVAELMATCPIRFEFPQLQPGTDPATQVTRVWVSQTAGSFQGDREVKCEVERTVERTVEREITQQIRTPQVSQSVSTIAAQPLVRQHLVEQQRLYGRQGGIVAEGRDIGTTVFPTAELKIFLTASIAERARRRQHDLAQQGQTSPSLDELQQQIAERDHKDSTRAISPLQQAADAIEVLTDGLTIEAVTEKIVRLYRDRNG
ncbi:MAG: pantoate--beta-alanine ligase [Synechococcales cyanobacterium RU_4_20]|nr:pantoate--beta-alanine ligase [Synechococcales cyanobacterium RU_4_20]